METTPQFFRHGPGPIARLVFFTVLALVLMVEDSRLKHFPELRQTIAIIIYPLQQLAQIPIELVTQTSEFFSNLDLISENESLKKRYLSDQNQLLRLRALEAENIQLRKLLDAKQDLKTKTDAKKTIMAEILYAPRDPFNRKATLNKGSQHGIQAGQILVDDKGIIGQLTRVYAWTSEATLITDKDHAVPVQILRNGLRTVISGAGKNDELELRYLSVNTDIKQGDLLVTSGIGGVYPTGLPVATVSKIERNPSNTFAQIICTPIAGVDRNRQLLILSMLPPIPENIVENTKVETESSQ